VSVAAAAESPILCRPAQGMDEEAVLQFVRTMFDGDDYVPDVWREWLIEDEGLLAVAVRAGEVAGLGHLADLGWGEFWLEGLRVRPDTQGQGVGSHLHDYFVGRWLASDGEVVRLATNVKRSSVHHMSERTGFHRLFEFGVAAMGRASEPAEPGWGPRPLADPVGIADRLAGSLEASAGLIDLGWRFAMPDPARLASLDSLRLARLEDGDELVLLNIWPQAAEAQVAAVAGSPEGLLALFDNIRGWMAAAGIETLTWLVPAATDPALAEEAGFAFESDHSLYVYERRR